MRRFSHSRRPRAPDRSQDTIRETIARCGAADASTRVLVKTLSSGKETSKTLALLAALNGGGSGG